MSQENNDVYIIIPAFNEATVIAGVLRGLRDLGFVHIIVVNDGSKDDTAAIAAKEGAMVVSHLMNRGVGAATQTGLEAAKLLGAKYAVTIDADAQHSPADVPPIVNELKKGKVDVVIGSRFLKKNPIPFTRRMFNGIANGITFFISGLWVSDSQSGFKGFSAHALEKVRLRTNGYECCSEIIKEIALHKLKYKEVPIDVTYSDYSLMKGQSFAGGVKTVMKLVIRSLMR